MIALPGNGLRIFGRSLVEGLDFDPEALTCSGAGFNHATVEF